MTRFRVSRGWPSLRSTGMPPVIQMGSSRIIPTSLQRSLSTISPPGSRMYARVPDGRLSIIAPKRVLGRAAGHRLNTMRRNNRLNRVSVWNPAVLQCGARSKASPGRVSGMDGRASESSRFRSAKSNLRGQRRLQVWQKRSFDLVRYSKPLGSPIPFPQQGHFPRLYLASARSNLGGPPTI